MFSKDIHHTVKRASTIILSLFVFILLLATVMPRHSWYVHYLRKYASVVSWIHIQKYWIIPCSPSHGRFDQIESSIIWRISLYRKDLRWWKHCAVPDLPAYNYQIQWLQTTLDCWSVLQLAWVATEHTNYQMEIPLC